MAIQSALLAAIPAQWVWGAIAATGQEARAAGRTDEQTETETPPNLAPHCAGGIDAPAAALIGRTDIAALRVACKAMPSSPEKSIVALAYLFGVDNPQRSQDGDYALDVLVVRSSDGEVIRRSHTENAIGSDAMRFTGLEIDTANYLLAPGKRAFGVTISHAGSSRSNPYRGTELRLFLEQDGALRQVLDAVRVRQYSGQWDTKCSGQFTDVRRTIAVGKTGVHGFADLVVSARSRSTDNIEQGEECRHVEHAPDLSKLTAHYNGERYALPDEGDAVTGPSAAHSGFSESACNDAFTRGDYAGGMRLLRIGLAAKDMWAQYLMAFNYEHGRGVKADRREAVKWHLLAAAQGNWQSSYDLGNAHESGMGAKKSASEALKWYRLAVRQGFPGPDAQAAVRRLSVPGTQ